METMTRYYCNIGSHDQLQDIRRANMELHHELDAIKRLLDETTKELQQAQDELTLAIEALVRARDIKP